MKPQRNIFNLLNVYSLNACLEFLVSWYNVHAFQDRCLCSRVVVEYLNQFREICLDIGRIHQNKSDSLAFHPCLLLASHGPPITSHGEL